MLRLSEGDIAKDVHVHIRTLKSATTKKMSTDSDNAPNSEDEITKKQYLGERPVIGYTISRIIDQLLPPH